MKNYTIFQKVYFKFIETSHTIEAKIKKTLSPYGLTHGQFNILRILRGSLNIPLTSKMIKERMIVENPDVTRLISRLTEKGFATREINPKNRREVHISISKKGLDILIQLDPIMKTAIGNYFEDFLSEKEAEQMLDNLSDIRNQVI